METVKEKTVTERMMEAYRQLAIPGEQHKQLARLAGSWTAKLRFWMEPGQPPNESVGTNELKMILGGRFLHSTEIGEMMGNAYEGISIMGYDNNTKKYVSTSVNTMSTSIMAAEGSANVDGTIITLLSTYDEPVVGTMKYRTVTTIHNDNKFSHEMFGTDKSGKETKMMDAVFTRRK